MIVIAIRVFTELPNETDAATLASVLEDRVSDFGTIDRHEIERYWKIPEWFVVLVSMQVTPDAIASFNDLLLALGSKWQTTKVTAEEISAIWDQRTSGTFFDPSVRWANVEAFPMSALDEE